MLLSSKHLCWSHRLQVLSDCWRFDQPKSKPLSPLCLVVFEVADVDEVDDDDDDEICSCSSLSLPKPTTANQLQVDMRGHSL